MTYFVDNLTVRAWFFYVLPRLIVRRVSRKTGPTQCFVVDSSRLVMGIARKLQWITGVAVEALVFRQVEMRDDQGQHVYTRIEHQDKYHLVELAQAQPAYEELTRSGLLNGRLPLALGMKISRSGIQNFQNPRGCLAVVQACAWKKKQVADKDTPAVLFLQRRPWLGAIASYASENGLSVIATPQVFDSRAFLKRYFPSWALASLRSLRGKDAIYRTPGKKRTDTPRLGLGHALDSVPAKADSPSLSATSSARVAVEYWGNLNLDQPERHSELFFWQQSSLPGSDVVVTFALPHSPLDSGKWEEVTSHGMAAVALHPTATTYSAAPLFTPLPTNRRHSRLVPSLRGAGVDAQWIKREIEDYGNTVSYWTQVLSSLNAKVFVSWYKGEAQHCAIGDALESLGGLNAIYQRSYFVDPSILTNVGPNIVFGYSRLQADNAPAFGGDPLHWVTTGYIGDHRFPLLRYSANSIRQMLREKGAQRIIAFFDDNSGEDPRWSLDYQWMRHNYTFLLEKVLAEPWFGLLIKPKVPSMLRPRLGPVADLLKQAEATGRCFVYEAGTVFGSHPPAEAAMAADVAIDCKMYTGSAAMDAALAGVPTLIMDREGWPATPLYQLGVGRVIFTDWDSAWQTCQEHWDRPGGTPGFGDWSPMLDELDPFRDGRAAERMGDYIHWLIQGFNTGLDRETVLANASERYCKLWGKDKIIEFNGASESLGRQAPTSNTGESESSLETRDRSAVSG